MSTQFENITLLPGKRLAASQPATGSGFMRRLQNALGGKKSPVGKADEHRATVKKLNQKVKLEEVHTLANQLAVLLDSGIPLLSALTIMSEQTRNRQLSEVLSFVRDDINSGATLHEAFSRFPKVFPKLFISLVKAAEFGGNLAEVLEQVSVYLDNQDKMEKRLKAATVYPKFVFYFFSVILIAVLFFLVPKFKDTFATFDAELPRATLILLEISETALRYLPVEIAVLVVVMVAIKKFKKTHRGQIASDMLKLRFPVAGDLIRKTSVSRFCRTLGILIRSGVPLLDALDISGEMAQNLLYTNAITTVKKGVVGGESLAGQLQQQQALFPAIVVKMIATGEQSGSLEKMLNNISDLYDTNVDAKISGMSSIIEPVLMVGLGIIAVIVILALYLPIFKVGSMNF